MGLSEFNKVQQLKAVIKKKDKKTEERQIKVDDLGQFTRMDELVFLTHQRYDQSLQEG